MQYIILKTISKILCLLPYNFILQLGAWLGVLYYYLVRKQTKRSEKQLQESLKLSDAEIKAINKNLYKHVGRTFLEIMYMPRLNQNNIETYFEVENKHYIDEALAENKGVVLLTAHLGNWEWLGAFLALSNYPITTVIKRQPNDQHTQILNEYREMVGIEVFARGTTELVGAAKALKKGKILAFLADQDAGEGGAWIKFLGKPASTPLGPAAFSKRLKSPILPVFIVRQQSGKHKVIVKEALYYENTGNDLQDEYAVTVKMTRVIEDIIIANPSQWLWFQKRWNTTSEMMKHNLLIDKD